VKKALFGVAKSEDRAASIVDQLKVAGFSENDISVLSSNRVGSRHFAHEQHTKAPEGAAFGAVSGVVLGAAFGWLVGIGTLAIPGLGPLLAAGPIIAALTGAGGGAVVGGVMGTMIGMGMPEFEAKQYDDKMKGGNILISVHTEDRMERDRAVGIFKNAGAVTAAEAVVGQAHGKPAPSTRVA
jgi:phosphohistidine swiveling domain-containing protein